MDCKFYDKRSQALHDRFTTVVKRREEIEGGRIDCLQESSGDAGNERFGVLPSQSRQLAVRDGILDGPRAIESEVEDLFVDLNALSPRDTVAWTHQLDTIEATIDRFEAELRDYDRDEPADYLHDT